MGVGPMNLVITNDALYQLSYTSEPFMALTASTGYIILSYADICKAFFDEFYFFRIRAALKLRKRYSRLNITRLYDTMAYHPMLNKGEGA